MPKRLTAIGSSGLVAIAEPVANLGSPLSNLQNIYFHSALDYMFIVSVISGTLNLPARNADGSDVSSAYGSTTYTLGTHGRGYVPLLFGANTSTGQSLVGETLIQAAGLASIRTITIGADTNGVFAREIFLNKDVSFGAVSIPFRIFVFDNPGD
jgi:hypothetical protein